MAQVSLPGSSQKGWQKSDTHAPADGAQSSWTEQLPQAGTVPAGRHVVAPVSKLVILQASPASQPHSGYTEHSNSPVSQVKQLPSSSPSSSAGGLKATQVPSSPQSSASTPQK